MAAGGRSAKRQTGLIGISDRGETAFTAVSFFVGCMEPVPPGQTVTGRETLMEQFEQYYRLPQDVVGHDAALLSYWDQMPAKAQLRLLESTITVSTLGELKMLAEEFGG